MRIEYTRFLFDAIYWIILTPIYHEKKISTYVHIVHMSDFPILAKFYRTEIGKLSMPLTALQL